MSCAGSGSTGTKAPTSAGRTARTARASARASYAAALAQLAALGLTYPCFCSPEELQLSRRAQLAAGRPPRYARTCAGLSDDEVERRIEAGSSPRCASAFPTPAAVEFDDLVHGPQRFQPTTSAIS